MRKVAVGLMLLVGCSSDTGGDVKGPFSGEVHRYHVDGLTLPSTTALQNQFADDLDGDGAPDNQLGVIVTALTATGDTNKHVVDMIRGTGLISTVDIQADSFIDDGSVGVMYASDVDDMATVVGGSLHGRSFTSNRTATTKLPATASVRMPVFADANPLLVTLVGAEIDLTTAESEGPDPDVPSGYSGVIRGGIPIEQARSVAYAGVAQMMLTNPTAHLPFARLIDTNKDGAISETELMSSALIAGLLVDDIAIGDQRVLSVAFGFHICDLETGPCNFGPPAFTCGDRVASPPETDVDCGGGTCPACATGMRCLVPSDCQSGACDAGKCRAPTCTDGFRDGFESDVDCGAQCGTCAAGAKCAVGADCASGHCNAMPSSTGTCG